MGDTVPLLGPSTTEPYLKNECGRIEIVVESSNKPTPLSGQSQCQNQVHLRFALHQQIFNPLIFLLILSSGNHRCACRAAHPA